MAEDELQRINAELEGYAHTVSHDLKGPLAAMMMAGQTLKALLEAGDAEAIAEVAGTIEDSAARATALIEDLLSLAEAGQEPAEITDVDVASVIADILAERAREIEDRGLSVTCADDMGLVRASPTHVYQLFSNLIANGIQHNDSATPEISLTLEQSHGGLANYLVRDNGPGIPEELLGRVFMPFAKGESGQTGIGLTIVEKIAGVYGGRVKAYNDDGACFEVSLPAGRGGGVSTATPLL
jgi:signal transduction histidine kinase